MRRVFPSFPALEESPIYPPIVLKPNPAPVGEQPLQPMETEPKAEPEIEEPAVPETGDIRPPSRCPSCLPFLQLLSSACGGRFNKAAE